MINKSDLVSLIIKSLREELGVIEDATSMANEEAMPSDDTAESQRENRSLEYQYLVDGQSAVAREHKAAILAYETLTVRTFAAEEPIALTALVELESGKEKTLYFLGPKSGGLEISFEGRPVYVLTPQSPLGRVLLGRNIGDTVEVEGGPAGRTARVTAIS